MSRLRHVFDFETDGQRSVPDQTRTAIGPRGAGDEGIQRVARRPGHDRFAQVRNGQGNHLRAERSKRRADP